METLKCHCMSNLFKCFNKKLQKKVNVIPIFGGGFLTDTSSIDLNL